MKVSQLLTVKERLRYFQVIGHKLSSDTVDKWHTCGDFRNEVYSSLDRQACDNLL